MLKRKQLLEQLEDERQELGLEREDMGAISSASSSDYEDSEDMDMEDSDIDASEDTVSTAAQTNLKAKQFKAKVLLLSSRGISSRQRHLLNDLHLILPHSKVESKFDEQGSLSPLNELAELNSCTHTLFLEHRKPEDLYIWLAKTPSGPSIRFHVENIHTLDELAFPGNCMIGTRPLLSFDASLSESDHGKIIQELLTSVFGTPSTCKKSKSYFDHLFHFGVADGRIWFRSYQIIENSESDIQLDGMSLVEIGPRFVLNPVRLFSGSFGGQTLWINDNFMTSAAIKAKERRAKAGQHIQRLNDVEATAARKLASKIERSAIDKVFDN